MFTTLSPRWRGFLFVLASSAFLSVTFVASKQAMRELSPLAFTPIWFSIASLWGAVSYTMRGERVSLTHLRHNWWPLFLVGVYCAAANFLFFSAIRLGDPTLVAFLVRSETVFTVLLGVFFLGERLSRRQWLGTLLTVAGAGVMTYQGGQVVLTVLVLAITSQTFNAMINFTAKQNVEGIPPTILNIARTLGAAIILAIISALLGELRWPSWEAWLWMIGGSFFGPFLSYVFFFEGLKTMDVGLSAVIRATQPLFVAVYSLILFGTLIDGRQFLGGLIILIGIGLIVLRRRRRVADMRPEKDPQG